MDDDTQVYHSCSATLNGETYVFGGNNEKNQVFIPQFVLKIFYALQISKIIGCGLKRIGDLNYDFYLGACGTYLFPEERVMLCFGDSYKTRCER